MSFEVIQTIDRKVHGIPEALEPAIKGAVARAKKNYSQIVGINRSNKFFYAEAAIDEYRRTQAQRLAQFYFSFGLANPLSGDLFDQEFRSWSELRAEIQGEAANPVRTLWDLQEESDALLARVRSLMVSGNGTNRIELRFVLIQLRRNADQMLRQCEREVTGNISLIFG